MRKNLGLLAVLAVVIVVVAISGCSNNNNNQNINDKSTKLAITNNGTTWAHVELVGNATHKNGTNMTIWADTFIKPDDNVTIDLSDILGYGNEPLPPGTTIRFQSWKGLFNNTTGVGDENTLNITFQGWSNNRYPTANDNMTNVTFSPMTVYQLHPDINESVVFLATTEEELAKIHKYDTSVEEPVYEEEILIVNQDGSVTIILSVPPELCRAIASIV